MSEEIVKVPDIGDASNVEVIELCVAVGDEVSANDPLIVLESDKASMEVPSPCAGVIKSMKVEVGGKVSEGSVIAVIENSEDSTNAESTNEQPVKGDEASKSIDDSESQSTEVEPSSPAAPSSVAPGSAQSQKVLVAVPDIGDEQDVEVIEISVKPGDSVQENDTLIVLESDKASMEVPSPHAGVVIGIEVSVGDKVSAGSHIVELEVVDEVAVESNQESVEPESDLKGADRNVSDNTSTQGAEAPVLVKVPDIGDASDVEVIEVTVAVGDKVERDETLIVLESDKASMEIPSPYAGTIGSLLVKVGDKVGEGTPVLELQTDQLPAQTNQASETSISKPKEKQHQPLAAAAATKSSETSSRPSQLVYAGPAVRMLARELGVDLAQVTATGPRERILKEDVQNFVKQALKAGGNAQNSGLGIPPVPEIDFSQFGEIERIAMTRVQKLTASAMHRSWLNVPHVTHFDEADITDLEDFRALKKEQATKRGLKLTPLPFLLKACAVALRQYPQFNVSLAPSGEELIRKQYCNIGIAMNTPAGLMVPIIKDVDKKGIWELAEEATELGVKGQEGKLRKEDLQGGCFTVSSLGAIGGTGFTPIVNTPEVAILGVSRTSVRPLYLNGEFVPRKMLPLTLSYDHRAINGVDAGQFVTFLTQVLSDIRKLVM